jgi:hypothetical protein
MLLVKRRRNKPTLMKIKDLRIKNLGRHSLRRYKQGFRTRYYSVESLKKPLTEPPG